MILISFPSCPPGFRTYEHIRRMSIEDDTIDLSLLIEKLKNQRLLQIDRRQKEKKLADAAQRYERFVCCKRLNSQIKSKAL